MSALIRFIIFTCLTASFQLLHAEVESFYTSQQRLIEYYDSGQYMKEFSSIASEAKQVLIAAIENRKPHQRLAIVLDIDETAISNKNLIFAAYSLVFKVGDSVPQAFFTPFQNPYNAPALQPVLDLYQYAIEHNVSVFFISARRGEGQAMTEKNLKNVGYTKWAEVMLLKPDDVNITSESFKSRSRNEISAQGYDIVLTLGDQNSDVNGPNAGRAFLLPNPFYYTP